jgi:hypothetical protein
LNILTGYNFSVPGKKDIAAGIDYNGTVAWVDNYCREHPLDSLVSGVEALIQHLKKR